MRVFLSLILCVWPAFIGRAFTPPAASPTPAAPDMRRLELDVSVFPRRRALAVTAVLHLNLGPHHLQQTVLRLNRRLKVRSVTVDGRKLAFKHRNDRLQLIWPKPRRGLVKVAVSYQGVPPVAERPPWQGGFVWSQDRKGRPWVSLACQIKGADMWLPVSGDFTDKIDTLEMRVTVPRPLFCAANGRLVAVNDAEENQRTFIWRHQYPIIPYNISLNVADYRVEQRSFAALPDLPIVFYSLKHDPGGDRGPAYKRKRSRLFNELEKYLAFLSGRYGPYPWSKEKLAVAHTPFLGMEHQTINAYGNGFRMNDGYDEILFHELAHEWFGNRVTAASPRDLWLQEGITTYITGLYLAEQFGPARAFAFYREQRDQVVSTKALYPAQEPTIVDAFHNDIYTKGALVLRTLGWVIGEEKLDAVLVRWVTEPALQQPGAATTAAFRALVAEESGFDFDWFFEAYLHRSELPRLNVTRAGQTLTLAWDRPDFQLPVPIQVAEDEATRILVPMEGGRGQLEGLPAEAVVIDPEEWILRYGTGPGFKE